MELVTEYQWQAPQSRWKLSLEEPIVPCRLQVKLLHWQLP